MKKLVGYIMMLLGVLVIFLQLFGSKLNIAFIQNLQTFPKTAVWIVAGALLVVGFFISMKVRGSKEQTTEEVPIYHGEKIVGYRRH
jgi:hypothetical protein